MQKNVSHYISRLFFKSGFIEPIIEKFPDYKTCIELSKEISIFANEPLELEIIMNQIDAEEITWGVPKVFLKKKTWN